MCHQGGQTLRAGSTFEQERDQNISHLEPLKAGVRPRYVMALTSSKAVMTIMQSSRNMSWGLCLLLAGAVLVAGTSKSCASRRTLFLATDCQSGSYIGIEPWRNALSSLPQARVGRDCAIANDIACSSSPSTEAEKRPFILLMRLVQCSSQGSHRQAQGKCTRRC